MGKTTALRDIAKLLVTKHNRTVMIVDKSNEVAGGGDVPYLSLGRAGRLQVPPDKTQYDVMVCSRNI